MEILKNRFIIFTILLTICLTPISAYAEEDLVISSWLVESNLMSDGSLTIVKDITYDFNSDFNGIYLDITLGENIEIDNLRVNEIVSEREIEYVQDQRAKKGQNGVYSTDLKDDYINIMIFSPSDNESKTFRINYSLRNVASIHSDTGEFYYKFIGKNNETQIEYFKANLDLPKFNQEDIKIFAHGPLNGNINFDNESIKLEVNNVPSNTFIEARVLFPLDYIPNATRQGNSSLNTILNEERALADKIIEDGIKKQERKSLFNNMSAGFSVVGVLIFGFLLNKFRRKPDLFNNMNSIYPDEISPAELSLFMNSMIVPRAYIATLLDLARRNIISFETYISDSVTKIKSENNELTSYLFTKNNNNSINLMEHEKFFMHWFFNEIGDSVKVSTDDINDYRERNITKFSKSQNNWSKIVKDELNSRDYYDPKETNMG